MVKDAAVKKPRTDWDCTYIPHGIPEDKFYPLSELVVNAWTELKRFKKNMLHGMKKDFVIFWNNRNIRRKLPSDIILAYKTFCDILPKEQSKKC